MGSYYRMLAHEGKLVFCGMNNLMVGATISSKVTGIRPRGPMQGANTGSIVDMQALIDLCAKEKIYPHIEVWPVHRLNEIMSILATSNDSGKRYVLDMSTLNDETEALTKDLPPPTLEDEEPTIDIKRAIYLSLKFSWARRP